MVERIQSIHILRADIEAEHVCVGGNAIWVIGLGQWYPALLQRIADQDLLRGMLVLLRDLNEGRVIGFVIADDGRVGFDDDTMLLAVRVDGALLTPWVKLYRKKTRELVNSFDRDHQPNEHSIPKE